MLPFRSGGPWKRRASAAFFLLAILGLGPIAAQPKSTPAKPDAKLKNPLAAGGIPLPIGHEAKGLVLPDYNAEGHLQARFEAALAKRIDADRILFTGLKMTTYSATGEPDLSIDMPSSTLDLNTRIITSDKRTTVTRTDFEIAGDTMRFDTTSRKGDLAGNVKMVLTNQPQLLQKSGE